MTFVRKLALPTWLITLVAMIFVLAWAGNGALALPSFGLDSFNEWTDQTDPVVATIALARAVAFLAVCYLLACTALSMFAKLLSLSSLARFVDMVSAPSVRRFNRRLCELSLVGMMAMPVVSTTASASTFDDDVPVLRNLSPAPVAQIPVIETPAPESVPEEIEDRRPTTWAVQNGENLWVISETVLTERLGRTPLESEITQYWLNLVEQNRDVLLDPDNPDLIFTGQVVTLPEAV